MQQDDIYENLDVIHEEIITKDDNENASGKVIDQESLLRENQKLKQELEDAKNQIQQLKVNISALFKTAQNEIQKRDRYLQQMRKQLREEQMKPYIEPEDA